MEMKRSIKWFNMEDLTVRNLPSLTRRFGGSLVDLEPDILNQSQNLFI